MENQTSAASESQNSPRKSFIGVKIGLFLIAWFMFYHQLLPLSRFLTYDLLGLQPGGHLGSAVEFFLYDTPKVLMLLVLVVFGVGILRSFITPELTRKILAGRRESTGNVLAALLGVVTPFLFLFSGAPVYRICHGRYSAGGNLLLSDLGPYGQ